MSNEITYIFMAFGVILALLGVILFVKRPAVGRNRIKILGIEFELSTPALVIFILGLGVFVFPFLGVAPNDDGPIKPNKNQSKGAYFFIVLERDRIISGSASILINNKPVGKLRVKPGNEKDQLKVDLSYEGPVKYEIQGKRESLAYDKDLSEVIVKATANGQGIISPKPGEMILALLGVILFVKRPAVGRNRIKILGIEFELSTPALVIFILGLGVFVFPFLGVAPNDDGPIKPNKNQSKGAYFFIVLERDRIISGSASILINNKPVGKLRVKRSRNVRG